MGFKRKNIKNLAMAWTDFRNLFLNYMAIIFVLPYKVCLQIQAMLLIFKCIVKYVKYLVSLYYVLKCFYVYNLIYPLSKVIQKKQAKFP